MSEKPIIFSAWAIPKLLDGSKTMTRRVVKLPKWLKDIGGDLTEAYADGGVFAPGQYLKVPCHGVEDWEGTVQRLFCPYGYPYKPDFLIEKGEERVSGGLYKLDMQPMKPEDGDRLWVRETFYIQDHLYLNPVVHYKADEPYYAQYNEVKWQSPLFMPRWASRIILEIVEVRVERLQNIKCGGRMFKSDVQKEGCPFETDWQTFGEGEVQWFIKLWDSLNAKKGYPWVNNDWVWPISFRRI